ncbi:hypothetical protein CONPUDRAFT_128357 [Coniophora puteana RWD-64-598 SS2]|uniref:Cytochrome P450 n=1 Tax=Coniophora puteana (strain RWD-64-598) TaxID=741705 RepID=A0A5M3MIY9_CONPW|nr:uncharacterized protein CONPUDRAFT_128357 [Coniophora puteana RWD-64-598 SS2]EIW78754.1 hypothetical protein CONPUDRAFT_128357 [Coniophora puteana RWD-64-598 SS2]
MNEQILYLSLPILALLTFLYLAFPPRTRTGTSLPLPPGPPAHWLPGIGSPWTTTYAPRLFAKWTEEYGPVFALRRGWRDVYVVIGRWKAAQEIMEREGGALADRPSHVAAGEVLSGGMRIVTMGSGERLVRLRRLLHAVLQPKLAASYEPLQTQHSHALILDILADPAHHQLHARRYAAAVILALTYGKTSPTHYDDAEVVAVRTCLGRLGSTMRHGAWRVDARGFGWLRWVPGYLGELRGWHREERALFEGQLEEARRRMDEGDETPCLVRHMLEHQAEFRIADEELAYVAGSMFGAGSETTASAVTIAIMAATLHPDAQTKVQEELDAVVGRERAPTFEDRPNLPQTVAFMLEAFRWRPVSVGGFAHRATRDVIWSGYRIPEGAVVIANHWAIAHDPEVYPEPEKFDPQRWIDEEGRVREEDRRFCTYGFGRRVCPGNHVANRSVFINTALILWAFRLRENPTAPIDSMAFSDASNMHADPFEVVFENRIEEGEMKRILGEV